MKTPSDPHCTCDPEGISPCDKHPAPDPIAARDREVAAKVREACAWIVQDGITPEQQLVSDSIKRAIRALDLEEVLK